MILGKIAKSAPHAPGVYIFRRGRTPVYIGKAANLKKRLSSYFRANAAPKVRALRAEATNLAWQETKSEIEALILEAELIKKHLPKYNVLLRDDKSYFYVALTRGQFPKIFVVHKTNLDDKKYRRVVGPFTSGSALRATFKILRRAFPYCTCAKLHNRPCLNAQIGRCLGFCCIKSTASFPESNYSLIRTDKRIVPANIKRYRENIRKIIAVLSGRRKRIASGLKRSMREAAKKQDFELAAKLRDQWDGLENIFAHRRMLELRLAAGSRTPGMRAWHRTEREIQSLLGTNRRIRRAEGYDISNISGAAASGSMAVFTDGKPAKSEYRKFKIRTVRGANDVASHREVMRRRLEHREWPYPDLIVMDGGKPQLNAALTALRESRTKDQESRKILVTALAKREEELHIEGRDTPVRLDSLSPEAMHFFQRLRDESHRFAKKYHHKLREISYRQR